GRRENPYYVCGGYVSSGASICDGLRVSMAYLDDAVLDGLQKRLERVLDRDVLRQRLEVLLDADRPDPEAIEPKQARLVAVRSEINRAVAAITAGPEDLPSLRAALIRLERERESLETELAAMTARMAAPEASEQIADELIESLTRSREVLEAGEPEERKALVRAFLRGIEIRKSSRQALLAWYRLPNPDNLSVKLVAPRGFGSQASLFQIAFEGLALTA